MTEWPREFADRGGRSESTGRPYIIVRDDFECDDAKAERNLRKHGVSFVKACAVFEDVFAYERFDFESSPTEIRYMICGSVSNEIFTVIYTERAGRTRIISARKATNHEENEYYSSQTLQ